MTEFENKLIDYLKTLKSMIYHNDIPSHLYIDELIKMSEGKEVIERADLELLIACIEKFAIGYIKTKDKSYWIDKQLIEEIKRKYQKEVKKTD